MSELSPIKKVLVRGADAGRVVDQVITRDDFNGSATVTLTPFFDSDKSRTHA
jgi:hypothetical protein